MFVRPSVDKEEATLEDVLARLEQMEARLIAMQRGQNGTEPASSPAQDSVPSTD
jgi:hypothetical protein